MIMDKDITWRDFLGANEFFGGGCKSAELIMELLQSCQQCSSPDEQRAILELQSSPQRQHTPARDDPPPPPGAPVEGNLLPFQDMWCTLWQFFGVALADHSDHTGVPQGGQADNNKYPVSGRWRHWQHPTSTTWRASRRTGS